MLISAHRAGTPRLFVIEAEYVLYMKRSELDWVHGIIAQIESDALPWLPLTQQTKPKRKRKITRTKAKEK